jgi:hypothetical protein
MAPLCNSPLPPTLWCRRRQGGVDCGDRCRAKKSRAASEANLQAWAFATSSIIFSCTFCRS